ncbi:MlaD family protein [Pseudonocardia spinosispora]|uniref:MlaD family protein n=1 Tax=Pseudonocardia spinosispora TaxID=103441 RepID=UPI0004271536|nr:MlaD family protein [Pseudonocardia spinosispora]
MSATRGRTLHQRWQRLRTVPGLGRDVTVLIALAIIGSVTGALILSQTGGILPWQQRSTVRIEVADAIAVSPRNSQEVRIAGVEVGQIVASEPTDHNTSIVTLAIEPGHPVYDNARAVLRPVNPLNQMYVTLNPGGPPGHPLPDGGVLPVTQTSRPVQLDEVLNKFDDRNRAALTQLLAESDDALVNAPSTVPAGLAAADTSMLTLRPVVERLQTRSEHIRDLVGALSELSAALGGDDERLRNLVDSTQQVLGVLSARDGELGDTLAQLPATTNEVRRALDGTSRLAAQLNPALDDVEAASDRLPGALATLTDAIGPLRDTVGAARAVVDKARPLVSDLRPITSDLHGSLDDLRPVSACLDDATSKIAPWMYDLSAFVYNSNSLLSVSDPNGGWGRGLATVTTNNPEGVREPNYRSQNTYQQGGSPIGPYPEIGSGVCQR